MLVVGNDIIDRGLLLDADKSHISNATYYLTIEKIISGGDDKEKSSVKIGPREIVWVVSKERFNIDDNDCIALVSLKSSLTKQGLLALDTGFVDPGFEGPIGTVLVNFSDNDVSISKGEEFFRVIFIPHDKLDSEFTNRNQVKFKSVDEYANIRKKEIVRDYSRTFLNIDSVAEDVKIEIMKDATGELKKDLVIYLWNQYWKIIIPGSIVLFLGLNALPDNLFVKLVKLFLPA